MLCHHDWVMKMQTYTVLERPDNKQETVQRGHLEVLDETCRILNGLKLCSRYCAACQIACNIAEITMPMDENVETWSPSPVVIRRP
jgi:hypothetical protein